MLYSIASTSKGKGRITRSVIAGGLGVGNSGSEGNSEVGKFDFVYNTQYYTYIYWLNKIKYKNVIVRSIKYIKISVIVVGGHCFL